MITVTLRNAVKWRRLVLCFAPLTSQQFCIIYSSDLFGEGNVEVGLRGISSLYDVTSASSHTEMHTV